MSRPRVQGPCSEPGCDRDVLAKGLCNRHYRRMRAEAAKVADPGSEPVQVAYESAADGFVVHCPNSLVPLVAAVVDLDARGIVRLIWPHLLEAYLAGVEPFTLEPVAS